MNRVHLLLLWHMHQPQYKDPSTGRYVMPWTRLHALKDYWGMLRLIEEFPGVRMTFNVVPALAQQIEEYASGNFNAPYFTLTFKPADALEHEEKLELLRRAFQVNYDTLLRRWPRFVELFDRARDAGLEDAAEAFGPRDWLDLQVLSQIAWFDEEYLGQDLVVSALSARGANFTEDDKSALKDKELELLRRVLPEYRAACERGQIELSTTPFYHPILPLLCDTDVAREANPHSPLPSPAFRHPEDAREQLRRAVEYHQRLFGRRPHGLWPSEGSVSDAALEIAADLGFTWFATDEGVLGRTLNVGFWRDNSGFPGNADKLYAPLRWERDGRRMHGVFRDHHVSDLIGFVYSRMSPADAAADLHRRIRMAGERSEGTSPVTVTLILDGENAWEYYPGGGREFLRQFYSRIEKDADIRALTVSEAIAEAGEMRTVSHIAPGSWINANFNIWIGHAEDVHAWDLLREARDFHAAAEARAARGEPGAPSAEQLARSYESVLAAEGSDWCWWYGPEHSSANDAEFDALYRKHLTEIYAALGAEAPETLAHPIKKHPERALVLPPAALLEVDVDGRVSHYFEWMGAGLYAAERQSGAMHGRSFVLREMHFGFDRHNLFLRVDCFPGALAEFNEFEFRIGVRAEKLLTLCVHVAEKRIVRVSLERNGGELPEADGRLKAAFDRVLELRIARELIAPRPEQPHLGLSVALWEGGLPVDVLPLASEVTARLGEENFAWAPAAGVER